MKATELAIAGAWVFEPRVFPDARGRFAAPYQAGAFHEALGFDLHVAQVTRACRRAG
jgi:dTDP-4-dehydrorhamnose 3,5-epimerase